LEVGALALLGPAIFFGWMWASYKTKRQEHKIAITNGNAHAKKAYDAEEPEEGKEKGPAPTPKKALKYTKKWWWRILFLVCLFFSATLSGAASLSVWQLAKGLDYESSSQLFQGKVKIHAGSALMSLQGVAAALTFFLFGMVLYGQFKEKEATAYSWIFRDKPVQEKVTPFKKKTDAEKAKAANGAAAKGAAGGGGAAPAPAAAAGGGQGGGASSSAPFCQFNIVRHPSDGERSQSNQFSEPERVNRVGAPSGAQGQTAAPKAGGGTPATGNGSATANKASMQATVGDGNEAVPGNLGGSANNDTSRMKSTEPDKGTSNAGESAKGSQAGSEAPKETGKGGNANGRQGKYVIDVDSKFPAEDKTSVHVTGLPTSFKAATCEDADDYVYDRPRHPTADQTSRQPMPSSSHKAEESGVIQTEPVVIPPVMSGARGPTYNSGPLHGFPINQNPIPS
jgi:hypothetical protein